MDTLYQLWNIRTHQRMDELGKHIQDIASSLVGFAVGVWKDYLPVGWLGACIKRYARSFKPFIFLEQIDLGVEPIRLYHQGAMECTSYRLILNALFQSEQQGSS